MKVAAWQAPLTVREPDQVVARLRTQVERSEAAGVEVLCCPETVIGGLADGSPHPARFALCDAELLELLAPAASPSVTMIVGYTERGADALFNTAAIVRGGGIVGRYRKVYPGDRSAYEPGEELPVFTLGSSGAPCGIAICNDVQYVEPARVLAERGAAILFVPTYGAHRPEKYAALRARGNNLLVARAVENRITVVAADVAGREDVDGRISEGVTAVIDSDGTVLARAEPFGEDLLIVDVPAVRPPPDPRGWDGARNPAVAAAFLRLWQLR
jgi:5-aminopentanamidase